MEEKLDLFNIIGKAAEEAAKYKLAFERISVYYMSLMDGDTHRVEHAMALLREFGIIDEDGELVIEDDE